MQFICYPKCTTCQKAKKWLNEHNVKYTERHIVEHHPTYDELKEWYMKSKLPLVVKEDLVLVGFRETEWTEFLENK